MRRFRVWLNKNVPGVEPYEEIVEFEDKTPIGDIDEECHSVLDVLISNHLDTGWEEIIEKEPKSGGRKS